uniref:PiggyBac transposable element-derived protein domain-containing protein n=1 Tax=Knipowitschia caucasica TaxID=637954 RepID=A0AAV2JMM5_KNICA
MSRQSVRVHKTPRWLAEGFVVEGSATEKVLEAAPGRDPPPLPSQSSEEGSSSGLPHCHSRFSGHMSGNGTCGSRVPYSSASSGRQREQSSDVRRSARVPKPQRRLIEQGDAVIEGVEESGALSGGEASLPASPHSENTNLNAARNKTRGKKYKWTDINTEEMKKFIGVLLYMGVVNLPKLTDLWRKHSIYDVPFPSTVMPRDRFKAILSNLHISDPGEDASNELARGTEEFDPLHRVRPLLNMIRTRCMAVYHPDRHIAVDERMVATKARLSFKQYMRDKPTKWGLKWFVLADSNGYTLDFQLYTGNWPIAVGEYNSYMGGVDTSDQMLGTNSVHRKTRRWYITVFQHLLDIAVTNSFIIAKELSKTRSERLPTRQDFQEELAASLIGVPRKTQPRKPLVLTNHFAVPTSSTQSKNQRASMGRGQCVLCKRSTPWKCEDCDVGLCLQLDRNCFRMYHMSEEAEQ